MLKSVSALASLTPILSELRTVVKDFAKYYFKVTSSSHLTSPRYIDPKIRRSLIAVAVLNIVLNIPQIVLAWFQCHPPNALWDPVRQGQCDHSTSVYYTYFAGAVAAVSDFYLSIIPITMLAPLRIDRKLKWGLSFLMGCGIFAGVAAIVRTWAAKYIMSDDPTCEYP